MNSTINAQRCLIAHVLETINPELYNLCLELPKPMLSDFKHIKFIHYEFEKQFDKITMENKHIFLGCVYRLYNPTHLYGKYNKLPIGLRGAIADVLGYENPENINSIQELIPAYYKNPRISKSINDFADSVFNILSEYGELTPGESSCSSAQLSINLKALRGPEEIKVNIYSQE